MGAGAPAGVPRLEPTGRSLPSRAPSCRPRSARALLGVVGPLAIIAIHLVQSVAGPLLPTGRESSATSSPSTVRAVDLTAAPGAMRHDLGPARAAPEVVASPSWANTSSVAGSLPAYTVGAMAYDPLLHGGEFVYFGGRTGSYVLSSSTWAYAGSRWSNDTAIVNGSPSARYAAGMDFDPAFGGTVLVGGIDHNGTVQSGAWLLTTDRWRNLTPLLPPSSPEPKVAYPSVAWDPALRGLLAVGGCLDSNCSNVTNAAWLLNSSGWHAAPGSPNGIPTYSARMAFDSADNEMVRFGGETAGRNATTNETFALSGGGWANLTLSSEDCSAGCTVPYASEGGLLTWSGQSGSLILQGGWNPTLGAGSNETWSFLHGQWTLLGTLGAPIPSQFEAVAVNSSAVDPFGLVQSCPSGCPLASWSWGLPPAPAFTVLRPNPADAGSSVTLEVSNYPGNGSGPHASWTVDYGDGSNTTGTQLGVNFTQGAGAWSIQETHAWSGSGTYPVRAGITDFVGRVGTAEVNVTIDPALRLTANASATQVGTGVVVGFFSHWTGGTPPVQVGWNFGDGHAATGVNATHAFASLGYFNVTGQAFDGGGGGSSARIEVHVVKVLAVSIAANWSRVDVGVPVGFVGTATGGTGTYTAYAWDFGDGGRSSAASPSHAFTAPGNYSVRLSVTDSVGTNGSSRFALTVDSALIVSARFSPGSPSSGEPVQFEGGATNGTPPLSYHWDFGDGASAGTPGANHTFSAGGTYPVVLWVNDSGGGSQERTLTVTVQGSGGPAPSPLALLWIAVGVGGAIVAAGAIAVALRSRRRSAATPPDEGSAPPEAETPPEENYP